MSFKEFLPTSCEVFVIPLICAYVIFLMLLPKSMWEALIAPGLWFAFVSFGAVASHSGNKDHWLLAKRMLLIFGCLLPIALVLFWAWATGRFDEI